MNLTKELSRTRLALAVVCLLGMIEAADPFAALRNAAAIRRCIAQTVLQDGRVVRTWRQNGVVTVETNAAPEIVGVRQLSPYEERMENLRARFAESTNDMARVWADYHAATNIQAVTRQKLEDARDRALLPATKAALQKIIDAFYESEE